MYLGGIAGKAAVIPHVDRHVHKVDAVKNVLCRSLKTLERVFGGNLVVVNRHELLT